MGHERINHVIHSAEDVPVEPSKSGSIDRTVSTMAWVWGSTSKIQAIANVDVPKGSTRQRLGNEADRPRWTLHDPTRQRVKLAPFSATNPLRLRYLIQNAGICTVNRR